MHKNLHVPILKETFFKVFFSLLLICLMTLSLLFFRFLMINDYVWKILIQKLKGQNTVISSSFSGFRR